MSILEPKELPLELIEKIIDEAFYSQPSTNARRERTTTVDTLSSLACVSHVFRQRVNVHRFSIVSFDRRYFIRMRPLDYIHAFRDLLLSDVWVAPSMGIARHVRKLVLIPGECRSRFGITFSSRAVLDGSFVTIMNTVFRGGEGDPYSTSDYTLALRGFMSDQYFNWNVMYPEFLANLENLLDTRVATLELERFQAIPLTLLKQRHVRHISMSDVLSFQSTLNSQHIPEYTAQGPWNHLESLVILRAPAIFDLIAPGETPMLKSLTVTLSIGLMPNSISSHWQHWSMLEELVVNFDGFIKDHDYSHLRVDYTHMSQLKRLTINVQQKIYDSSIVASIEYSMQRILQLIGPRLPPLARLAIRIDNKFYSVPNEKIRRTNDIPSEIASASMDALLAQSVISTIIIRFGINTAQFAKAAPLLETFRQDGLDALREVFPRLSAGPRQRVYDSEVSKRWADGVERDTVLCSGTFSVVYTAATP